MTMSALAMPSRLICVSMAASVAESIGIPSFTSAATPIQIVVSNSNRTFCCGAIAVWDASSLSPRYRCAPIAP